LHNKPDLTFGQRRALMNDAQQRRPNARAAAAIPNMSGGGESMPVLTEQANDLEVDEQDTDESGAFITFAPALPTSSVGERADRDTGQARSRPSVGCCPSCGAGVYSCPCGETINFMCACFPLEPLYCGCANEITPGAAVNAGRSYIDVEGVDGHFADLVGAWDTDDDTGGESMPHLTMLSDAYDNGHA
jgi:hypothetical protein